MTQMSRAREARREQVENVLARLGRARTQIGQARTRIAQVAGHFPAARPALEPVDGWLLEWEETILAAQE